MSIRLVSDPIRASSIVCFSLLFRGNLHIYTVDLTLCENFQVLIFFDILWPHILWSKGLNTQRILSLTYKCHMLINILIMSPDTHSYSDLYLLSKEPHHTHYAPVWIQGRSHALILSMSHHPQCVWLSGCVLRPARWVWASWWQLLCRRVNDEWKPWPRTVTAEPDLWSRRDNIRRSETDCWTEQDKQQNDCQTDSRWSAADDSHSVVNLSDGRDRRSYCCYCFLKTSRNCVCAYLVWEVLENK